MLYGAVKCSVCGEYPIMQGGVYSHKARLVCPNYKSDKIQHGNINVNTQGIPMGFTEWNYIFATEEQAKNSTKDLIEEWNDIHSKKLLK